MIELRPFGQQDAQNYLNIANDKRCYFPFSFCNDLEEAEDVIDTYMHSEDLQAYAIVESKTKSLVGAIYAETYKNIAKNTVEVSYFVGEKYQKKGYAMKAIKILESILVKRKIKRIGFFIDPDNIASIKTATKFGAVLKRRSNSGLDYYQKVINHN